MSKRSVQNDIDDLADSKLGDLSPAERCQLVIEGVAAGKDDWVHRLRDTAPVVACRATDPDYTERVEWAHRLLQQAIYDLHTTSLQFDLLNHVRWSRFFADATADQGPSDEELESAAEQATHLRELIVELYSAYHANRRFATEVLGVGFETWVDLHPNGVQVLERVEDQLSDDIELELAEEHLEEKAVDGLVEDVDYPLLETLATVRYEALLGTWEEAVE